MGLWKNIKIFMGFEDEGDFESDYTSDNNSNHEQKSSNIFKENRLKTQKASLIELQSRKKNNKIQSEVPASGTEMVLCEPKSHEDSVLLSSYIKEGKPIIVNLKYLDAVSGKRLIDFVCGTVYAFEGHMQKLGSNIFLFTPCTIGIVNKQHDELEFNQDIPHYDKPAEEELMQEEMFQIA